MNRRIGVLGSITILGLLAILLSFGVSGWAQKASIAKPPKPPAPPADPAIAYVVRGQNSSKLMVMNADGTNQRVVLSEKMVEYCNPDWSPDGTKLVFTRYSLRDGGSGIYAINVDGTGLSKIVSFNSTGSYTYTLGWSPVPLGDGLYKIAFVDSTGPGDLNNNIFLVNPDGTGLVQLTDTPEREASVAWSFLGQYLVTWTFGSQGDDYILYQIEYIEGNFVATSLGSIFKDQYPPLPSDTYGDDIDWANTQNKLIVSVNAPENNTYDLWMVDVFNPANTFRLTNTLSNLEFYPSWSPDDSRVLFLRPDVLWLMNADGSGETLIGPGFREPEWRRNL